MIGTGGTVYLSCANKTVGAVLFAVGLFTICVYGMNLYTGKIGYVSLTHFWRDMRDMGLIWCGNLVGTGLCGLGVRLMQRETLTAAAEATAAAKAEAPLLTVLISAVFCGMLMYMAVNTYRLFSASHPVVGIIAVFLGVVTFILSGFEHSIADMFYFGASGCTDVRAAAFLLTVVLGNTVGSLLLPFLSRIGGKNENKP